MIKGFENTGMMLLTDTLDRKQDIMDIMGAIKNRTYFVWYDRTAFAMGRSMILRSYGLLWNENPDDSNNIDVKTIKA